MDHRLEFIVAWLRSTAESAGGLLVPVSGGSDSALCFWLCAAAFPERTTGVYFGDALRAKRWFESVGNVETRPAPSGNPQQRDVRRWMELLELGLHRRCWLVGSRNRTEEVFGTYSLASLVVGCLPLAGLWKSEVIELSWRVGIPPEILQSSRRATPTAGVHPN